MGKSPSTTPCEKLSTRDVGHMPQKGLSPALEPKLAGRSGFYAETRGGLWEEGILVRGKLEHGCGEGLCSCRETQG